MDIGTFPTNSVHRETLLLRREAEQAAPSLAQYSSKSGVFHEHHRSLRARPSPERGLPFALARSYYIAVYRNNDLNEYGPFRLSMDCDSRARKHPERVSRQQPGGDGGETPGVAGAPVAFAGVIVPGIARSWLRHMPMCSASAPRPWSDRTTAIQTVRPACPRAD